MKILALAAFFLGASAQASPSVCAIYVAGNTTPVKVEYSCDGGDLRVLFTTSGITAGISKAGAHFLGQGYTLNGCSEGNVAGSEVRAGYSYTRCQFVKP